MRAVPAGHAKDGGDAGSVDEGLDGGGRSGAAGRAVACAEAGFDLRSGANCAGADSIGDETFPRHCERAREPEILPGRCLFPPQRTDSMSEHSHSGPLTLTIDGQTITVPHGTTIFDAARLNNIPIPTLCHQQNQVPVAVCRVCVVDCGERAYQAACIRECEPDMKVLTNSPGVLAARKTLYELLMADHPAPCKRQQQSGDCELEGQAATAGVGLTAGLEKPRFPARSVPVLLPDESSLSIAVDYAACILCDRCVRGCSEIKHNFVIARQGKGYHAAIAFDDNQPMGNSSCVSCGECMVSCPTGALTNRRVLGQNLQAIHPDAVIPTPEELLAMPVFHGVSGTFLELNQGAV